MEKKSRNILLALSHGPVQRYILEHENKDIRNLVLRNKAILGIPTAQLIEQIATRRKGRDKLPLYYNTAGVIFPPPLNFEQTSSQATALYKTNLIADLVPGDDCNGADITGGFGVDTFFLSRKFAKIHYVEPELSLLEIARYNHELLGAANIEYHCSTAEAFLDATRDTFDFIYADPSRRITGREKVHAIEDAQPDITRLKAAIFRKTTLLVVKASPLLDIQAGIGRLGAVKKVVVLSVDNECKELLFICRRGFQGPAIIEAVNILKAEGVQSFTFSFSGEQAQPAVFSDPLAYLYEPNASILKAGAFKSVAAQFNVKKIQANTHLYTADTLVEEFPGRKFAVEALVKPDSAMIKKYFPDAKANVTTRNYPLSPALLKKKTKLRDGGEKFLIGFSGERKKFLVVARRI